MALDGTYSGLKASVADFLNRSDLTAAIPDFVTMATGALTRRLIQTGPVREMLGRSDATITTEYSSLPSDFMGIRSLYLNPLTSSSGKVQFCEPEKIAEQKMLNPNLTGDPQLYSIVGGEIQFWPWNGNTYTAEIGYWQSLTALSGASDTNWLLTKYPDAYLYTSLLQSAPYLKDDQRLDTWGTLATQIVADIVAADKVARFAPEISPAILSYDPP